MNNKFPNYIMEYLRQRLGLDEDDSSLDDVINQYSKAKAFNEVLKWQGLIDWDMPIKGYIQGIYGIELE